MVSAIKASKLANAANRKATQQDIEIMENYYSRCTMWNKSKPEVCPSCGMKFDNIFRNLSELWSKGNTILLVWFVFC